MTPTTLPHGRWEGIHDLLAGKTPPTLPRGRWEGIIGLLAINDPNYGPTW
jgi:hypothetical protein